MTLASYVPQGYRAVTPYLVAQDAPALIEFVVRVFDAEERHRSIGSAGGLHAELRLGDSVLMIGGGAPHLSWRGQSRPAALHTYVKDVDAAFDRAVHAGAAALHGPADQEYGERSAAVKDASGNHWYIASWKGPHHVPEGLHTVNVCLHPVRAEPVIAFMTRAFEAEVMAMHASPDGAVRHAKVRIGDSIVELGEAHGPYQPLATMFYLHVPDVDAAYPRALAAGASSMSEPADRPFGVRMAGVEDAFGNQWYLASPVGRSA